MEEAGGEIILEVEEKTSQEEDAAVFLQILMVEDRMRTQVSQVVTDLINQRLNVTIIINMVIMHMNARRSNMTKESKARINQQTPAFHQAQC